MTASKKNPVGRPPKFKTKEEIEVLIKKYFEECEGVPFLDENGMPMMYKGEIIYKKKPKPPTVTGLALALGFLSRQALLEYQGKKEFHDTITRAKLVIEEYTERRLFDRDGSNGAKFSLMNNFKGWTNSQKEPQEDLQAGMVALVQMLGKQAENRDINNY